MTVTNQLSYGVIEMISEHLTRKSKYSNIFTCHLLFLLIVAYFLGIFLLHSRWISKYYNINVFYL